MKNCKYCNQELNDDAKFCSSCGRKVEEEIVGTEINIESTNQSEVKNETIQEENQKDIFEEKIQNDQLQSDVLEAFETPKFIECSICGAVVDGSLQNCPVCGALLKKENAINDNKEKKVTQKNTNKKNGFAIAGFIIGIVANSFFGLFAYDGVLYGVIGLVFAILGLVQINKGKGKGKPFAIIGICLCGYAIFYSLIYTLFLANYLSELIQELEDMLDEMLESGLSIKNIIGLLK